MFTSRAEQRLMLRIDNADERLSRLAWEIGMLPVDQYREFVRRTENRNLLREHFRRTVISVRSEGYPCFSQATGVQLSEAVNLSQLAKRPELGAEQLAILLPEPLRERCSPEEITTVVTDFKYEGYMAAEESLNHRLAKAAGRKIPAEIQYSRLPGLSNEMVERLDRIRPQTIGQAMRIPGVTPAAISLLTIHVELLSRQQAS
jgi:tRNA uridine 5-carboxymethylaminomethyl modification enzyme